MNKLISLVLIAAVSISHPAPQSSILVSAMKPYNNLRGAKTTDPTTTLSKPPVFTNPLHSSGKKRVREEDEEEATPKGETSTGGGSGSTSNATVPAAPLPTAKRTRTALERVPSVGAQNAAAGAWARIAHESGSVEVKSEEIEEPSTGLLPNADTNDDYSFPNIAELLSTTIATPKKELFSESASTEDQNGRKEKQESENEGEAGKDGAESNDDCKFPNIADLLQESNAITSDTDIRQPASSQGSEGKSEEEEDEDAATDAQHDSDDSGAGGSAAVPSWHQLTSSARARQHQLTGTQPRQYRMGHAIAKSKGGVAKQVCMLKPEIREQMERERRQLEAQSRENALARLESAGRTSTSPTGSAFMPLSLVVSPASSRIDGSSSNASSTNDVSDDDSTSGSGSRTPTDVFNDRQESDADSDEAGEGSEEDEEDASSDNGESNEINDGEYRINSDGEYEEISITDDSGDAEYDDSDDGFGHGSIEAEGNDQDEGSYEEEEVMSLDLGTVALDPTRHEEVPVNGNFESSSVVKVSHQIRFDMHYPRNVRLSVAGRLGTIPNPNAHAAEDSDDAGNGVLKPLRDMKLTVRFLMKNGDGGLEWFDVPINKMSSKSGLNNL